MTAQTNLPPITELAREKRKCPKHGEYESIQTKIFSRVEWTNCDACDREAVEKEKRDEEDARYQKRLTACRVPLRFRDAEFATYKSSNTGQGRALLVAQAYAKDFGTHRADGRCIAMVGSPGTGKTHLAFSVAKQVMRAGFTARYTTVHEAIELIRETWRHDSVESESVVLKRLTSVDLLILDEVGVQYGKESEQIELFKILNRRYNDMLPTIVISNVSADDLKKYLGERAFDRLRENDGKVIPFDWESYRGS